ncbi:nitroreductase family protein [Fulvivirgaceae bacterium BMA10]|uniref:Nitroreductase family protein n=1 Tax=Splendidivirga corallicola TaxID=3051826 RepID=A0ABT8KXR4_9BACT|nr:nitroreductase family protein [Fulvivirgaceae bacterium BMA10]
MSIINIIKKRKTLKVMANTNEPLPVRENYHHIIEDLIDAAGWAPFHYACHKSHRERNDQGSIVPWRFYILDSSACRGLLKKFQEQSIDAGKILGMLAAADALIQVTWLPDPKTTNDQHLFDPSLKNMEHIAAASAAIQNLLLTATAKDIPNYWSSGGKLREPEVFKWLNIPNQEILLGSIFLFPENHQKADTIDGKLRDMRGVVKDYTTWITLD